MIVQLPSKKLLFEKVHLLLLLVTTFTAGIVNAQTATVTSVAPTVITYRSQLTITGTNLLTSGTTTTVRVNGITATAVSSTATQLVVTVPELAVPAGQSSIGAPVTITKGTAAAVSAGSVTYIKPASTNNAVSAATRVITDWQGYWSSTGPSSTPALQPDRQHSVTAMQFNGIIYSTGVDDAKLSSKGITYVPGNFKALPINSITGTSGASGASNYIALASKMDGSATSALPGAPGVAGLITKDILIDGVKGLGLGTGMTNITAGATMLFNVNNIVTNRINDNEPDIIVSQTADPTEAVYDIYSFVDANGNIVGNPVYIILNTVNAIGTYKLDLFSITANAPYDTAVLNGTGITNTTRPIRLVGYKLSDFGVTDANKNQIRGFKIMPSGVSDPAFIAYNAYSLLIPAPVITQHPASVVACTGSGTSATFSVTATGTDLSYQWKKNGLNIAGATSSTYTINNVAETDVATYTVVITNAAGSVVSNEAYLNTIIAVQPIDNTACLNVPGPTVEVIANGLNLTYQWYSNATQSNTGGTLIQGATSASYAPPVTATGTRYYYVVVQNSGAGCTSQTSTAAKFTVGSAITVGSAYAGNTAGTTTVTICPGTGTTLNLTGQSGTIQWEASPDGESGWNNVSGGSGATAATYTTGNLTTTTYYRARIYNASCAEYSNVLTVRMGTAPGTVSADQAICPNATAIVRVTGAVGTIQWQQSANGTSGWANVTGGTGAATASYTTAPLTSTTYFRALMTSGSCTSTSAATMVTVNPAANAGTISTDQTICPNNTATVAVTGTTAGTLQWQSSSDNTNWSDIPGATTASYITPVLTQTRYYRVVATNGSCTSTSGVTTVTVNDTYIWNGSVSTDWHTAGNWSCNVVPSLTSNVIIPQTANQPVVSALTPALSPALAKNLTVQDNAILTVMSGNNIQVQNAVTVSANGNFTIQNNANLIQDPTATVNNNSGKITIMRDSNTLYRLDYTLWTSPVAGQNLFNFSPATQAPRFYTYSTALDIYQTVPGLSATSTTTFAVGTAYLIRMPNGHSTPGYNAGTTPIIHHGQFTGTPNNGDINVPLSLAGQGWNATGNPYPSPINVHAFIDGNVNNIASGTLYAWRKRNNDDHTSYATITKFAYSRNNDEGGEVGGEAFEVGQEASWSLNVGQGFIVKAKPGATQVSFKNSMRRMVNNNQLFRNGQQGIAASRLWLNLKGTGQFAQAVVGYSAETTDGIDFGYDGPALNDGKTEVYTTAADTKLAIQAKGQFTDTDVVPVSYRVTNGGSYSFELDKTDGLFAQGQDIFLRDNLTGTIHDIKGGSYSFTTDAGTFTNRFDILYNNVALGVKDPAAAQSTMIYKNAAGLHIATGNTTIQDVQLYDIRGRVIYERKGINANTAVISGLAIEQQVVIVQVTAANGTTTSQKVIY